MNCAVEPPAASRAAARPSSSATAISHAARAHRGTRASAASKVGSSFARASCKVKLFAPRDPDNIFPTARLSSWS
eukprot:1151968-Pyramimonas_sp.AAC.1